ncbi:MAG: zinc ribbon domain-containing protein [Desulfobacteraceae bacterium]|jgi:putative FmdB family regulatory protein
MPIYEYHCRSCHTTTEVLVISLSDERYIKCAKCGSQNLNKFVSLVALGKSKAKRAASRLDALSKVDPTNPQNVAQYFKESGSRFGDKDFRGRKAWKNAVDRVARGGPTLEE